MSSNAALPPLYARWMEELLGCQIPAETAVNCLDCGMLDRGGPDRIPGLSRYHPETKCCTYHPQLAGFLAGLILRDESPGLSVARAELERRIESGVGVTPAAIQGSPLFRMAYSRNSGALFGKTRGLRCPYYLDDHGGACGIRLHRPGVCATWFCKHTRGRRAIRFWNALKDLFTAIEHDLSLWCVAQTASDINTVDALLRYLEKPDYAPEADDIDGKLKPERRLELWGAWRGRERELYIESARIVESLSWNEAASRCGPRVALLAGIVTETHRALLFPPPISGRLRLGQIRLLKYASDYCLVLACDEVLGFPRRLMEALFFFDGRPAAEVRKAILEEKKLRLSDAIIERLVDFELLAPVDDSSD